MINTLGYGSAVEITAQIEIFLETESNKLIRADAMWLMTCVVGW